MAGVTATPAMLCTPLMVIVTVVLGGKGVCGTKVTTVSVESKLMLDSTSVVGLPVTWIVLPVTVMGSMALLKITLIPALVPIFVEVLGGVTEVIVGATVSLVEAVVKLRPGEETATPCVLVTPLNDTAYVLPATRDPPGGVMRMIWPVLSNPTLSGVTYQP